jgi:hypothetical protein
MKNRKKKYGVDAKYVNENDELLDWEKDERQEFEN